ncbi:alpha-ketoglutarate-dependent dioxygenase abh1-like protein [Leptotrombidium deliense]|uniref:Alpha-ketoglutarate-dependent dioxygenase abh1-like protein n=1 Tax=Leptotrombidium deliense TaxID=299467 RepID=A0A443SWX9_9ACAR|nr:alpha-ketoglutarate-dependent dioxygenase abh1-like protein [Leptotrombidium deliense]
MIGNDTESDAFKLMFKKFKKYDESMANEVIDFDKANNYSFVKKLDLTSNAKDKHLHKSYLRSDFNNPEDWQIYTLDNIPKGLLVVRRIFTESAASKWFHKLLYSIPDEYANKVKSNVPLPTSDRETSNLRWVTFGYHHNWDTKVYSEKGEVPDDIAELCRCISSVLGLQFTAEAGIINYYTSKSTLSPHADVSEVNKKAPLFSLSLGSSAIFLVGGEQRCSSPISAMYLQNSDLLIMSEESRLSFHAIAKVLQNNNDSGRIITRINLNIRQVY